MIRCNCLHLVLFSSTFLGLTAFSDPAPEKIPSSLSIASRELGRAYSDKWASYDLSKDYGELLDPEDLNYEIEAPDLHTESFDWRVPQRGDFQIPSLTNDFDSPQWSKEERSQIAESLNRIWQVRLFYNMLPVNHPDHLSYSTISPALKEYIMNLGWIYIHEKHWKHQGNREFFDRVRVYTRHIGQNPSDFSGLSASQQMVLWKYGRDYLFENLEDFDFLAKRLDKEVTEVCLPKMTAPKSFRIEVFNSHAFPRVNLQWMGIWKNQKLAAIGVVTTGLWSSPRLRITSGKNTPVGEYKIYGFHKNHRSSQGGSPMGKYVMLRYQKYPVNEHDPNPDFDDHYCVRGFHSTDIHANGYRGSGGCFRLYTDQRRWVNGARNPNYNTGLHDVVWALLNPSEMDLCDHVGDGQSNHYLEHPVERAAIKISNRSGTIVHYDSQSFNEEQEKALVDRYREELANLYPERTIDGPKTTAATINTILDWNSEKIEFPEELFDEKELPKNQSNRYGRYKVFDDELRKTIFTHSIAFR